jgi:hypothetical protein
MSPSASLTPIDHQDIGATIILTVNFTYDLQLNVADGDACVSGQQNRGKNGSKKHQGLNFYPNFLSISGFVTVSCILQGHGIKVWYGARNSLDRLQYRIQHSPGTEQGTVKGLATVQVLYY